MTWESADVESVQLDVPANISGNSFKIECHLERINRSTLVEKVIMGDVVSMSKPDPVLVQMLEDLVLQAKRGELTDFAAVIAKQGSVDFSIHTPEFSVLELIGAIEMLKAELMAGDEE